VTLTVNTSANSLAVGTYGPTVITFANSDTGQGTTTITATLTVNPPALQVKPRHEHCRFGDARRPILPLIVPL
jgi:hypothetical protein